MRPKTTIEPNPQAVKELINTIQTSHKISHKEIANYLNISPHTLQAYKSRGNPPIRIIEALSILLEDKSKLKASLANIPIEEILEELNNRGYKFMLEKVQSKENINP